MLCKNNKKVLILGLSKSGIAASKFLNKKGFDCYISEFNINNENNSQEILSDLKNLGIKVELGKHSEEFIKNSRFVVVSPGIKPYSEIFSTIKALNIPLISEVQLAQQYTKTPFINVTGTNGKTTTTYLIDHLLKFQYKSSVCGNIGIPPTTLDLEYYDYLVCEVSSFQMETSNNLKSKIAIWLNFTPDHIDYHKTLENYFNSKAKLFLNNFCEIGVFNGMDKRIYDFSKTLDIKKYYFDKKLDKNCCYIDKDPETKKDSIYFNDNGKIEKIINIEEIVIPGHHNYQNIMASIIAVKKGSKLTNDEIRNGIKSFKPVKHRIEFVKKINKISFYNDSKATNPEASIVALKSFIGKKTTLIAGGRDKNTDLSDFVEEIKKNIKHVILFGEAANRFYENIISSGYKNVEIVNNLKEAVEKSKLIGDEIVLFSPACSSFDSFKNYEHRGDMYINYVKRS